jgi:hypothetical protein
MKHSIKLAIVLFGASIFLFSCKKDKSQPKQLLLSKVFRDGQLQHEYIYDTDKKVLRKNRYNVGQGQSNLISFRLYNYNADGLVADITDFTASSQFSDKVSLVYDVNKRVTRLNQKKSDNSITFYYVFEYDFGGKLSKYSLYSQSNDEKTVDAQFTYNADGFLSKIIRRSFINGAPVKLDSTTYSVDKQLPGHWNYYEMLLVFSSNFSDRIFLDMITNSSFYYRYDAPPQIVDRIFAEKIYDDNGYLLKQAITTKAVDIGPATITNTELSYEYVK